MLFKVSSATTKRCCVQIFLSSLSTAPTHDPTLVSHHFSLLHSSPSSAHLRHLHAQLLRNGLYSDVVLSSKLIIMYSRHQKLLPHSFSVFRHMPYRNTYSWNIMIGELSRSGLPHMSLQLFVEMLGSGASYADPFSLPLVLRACASLRHANAGACVHGFCLKSGFEMDVFVGSALVHFYVAVLKVCDARKLFDKILDKDSVLWTSMFCGYAQTGQPIVALDLFREMLDEGVGLDGVVMLSLLLICSQLGWPSAGKSVHGLIFRMLESGLNSNLANALLDMYVKCGEFSYAERVFDRMPDKDVISWSSMITGYGFNGRADHTCYLFEQMVKEGVRPNSVTFLGVLSACCHNGMAEKACNYFNMMKDFDVVPELKHYACMADMLARAGLLVEAERFINEMPMEPDGAVFGALLGGCKLYGNIEVGERVAKRLLALEPQRSGYYVLLANVYAAAGMYGEAERVREIMKERSVDKVPGWSSVGVDCVSHVSARKDLMAFSDGGGKWNMENISAETYPIHF